MPVIIVGALVGIATGGIIGMFAQRNTANPYFSPNRVHWGTDSARIVL